MKKYISTFLSLSTSFLSSSAFAGLINYLDVQLDNDTSYSVEEVSHKVDDRGKLLYLNNNNLAANTSAEMANFRVNWLGQLSQDVSFSVYNTERSEQVGTCSIHVGVGSYAARPDFTGSACELSNGSYLQLNPTYETTSNTYKVNFKLTKAKSFSRIILFGDSMSDNGNLYQRSVELSLIFPISPVLPISPPYFKGRFTNGQVWVEHLSQKLNIDKDSLLNYAYAGASIQNDYMPIPNLDKQVNKYLTWNRSGDPYALYVVWMGSNDFLRTLDQPQDEVIDSMIAGFEYNVRRLIEHGAKHLLAPSLPDLSFTPDTLSKDVKNGNNIYSSRMHNMAIAYNKVLAEQLIRLQNEFPDVHFMTYDVYKFIHEAHDQADKFGFSVIDQRCNPNSYWKDDEEICNMPKQYVFWDGIHPTAQAHDILAKLMYQVIDQNGYKPNVKTFKPKLPDEFALRNQRAIKELHKDIDHSDRKAFGKSLFDLSVVVQDDLPLF